MAQFATVKFSDLGDRLDVQFHIARESVADRLADLKANMTVEQVMGIISKIPNKHKNALRPLLRGQPASKTSLTANEIGRIEKEYPHLALALLEKEAPQIYKALEDETAENKQALDAVGTLLLSARYGTRTKDNDPTASD